MTLAVARRLHMYLAHALSDLSKCRCIQRGGCLKQIRLSSSLISLLLTSPPHADAEPRRSSRCRPGNFPLTGPTRWPGTSSCRRLKGRSRFGRGHPGSPTGRGTRDMEAHP